MFGNRFVFLGVCALVLLISPSTRADDEDVIKPFLGEWMTKAEDIEEGWLISKNKDGTLRVIGQYRDAKNFRILGGFEGRNVEVKDGKIHFVQVWVRKPKPNWSDNAKMTLEIEKGKLKFTWKLDNGSSGSRYLEAIRR